MAALTTGIDQPFGTIHSPFETALRTLVILCHTYPKEFDVPQIAVLNYLLVHSADLGGPASLHPATPYRSGETSVMVDLVERGVHLLISRGLAEVEFQENGLMFRALDFGASFLDALRAPYVQALRDRANWLLTVLQEQSPTTLRTRLSEHLLTWGSEFDREAIFRETVYE